MDEPLPSYLTPPRQHPVLILLCTTGLLLMGMGIVLLLRQPTTQAQTPKPSVFSPKRRIVVDVQGAVRFPGVQNHRIGFGEDLRLTDLIASAGGIRDDADQHYMSKNFNLSSKVEDGYKLYIPKMGEIIPTPAGIKQGMLAVNTASKEELMTLKGIGEARVETILSNRPYSSFSDFAKKTAFPQSVLTPLQPLLTF